MRKLIPLLLTPLMLSACAVGQLNFETPAGRLEEQARRDEAREIELMRQGQIYPEKDPFQCTHPWRQQAASVPTGFWPQLGLMLTQTVEEAWVNGQIRLRH